MSPMRSMTGFGRAEKSGAVGTFTVEIRSVNHRFLDVHITLPRDLSWLEMPLLAAAKGRLARGKVETLVRWTPSPDHAPQARFNVKLLDAYALELARIAEELGRRDERVSLEYLLGLPGVLEREAMDADQEAILALAEATLQEALDRLLAERTREGAAVRETFRTLLDGLVERRALVEARRDEVVEVYRQRLRKRAAEWAESAQVKVDDGRLETEIMLYTERSDIAEEMARLAVHLKAFGDLLEATDDKPLGKPMEFLAQEMLRETNTTASKSRDAAILSTVIEMKNEIEKIREQVLNVE